MEMQSEGGAAGTMHGALQGGALSTTFTESTNQGSFVLGYLDPLDPNLDYGYAEFDARHVFQAQKMVDLQSAEHAV